MHHRTAFNFEVGSSGLLERSDLIFDASEYFRPMLREGWSLVLRVAREKLER